MDAAPQPLPYRRIGTILVEKALITADQLATGLEEQQRTGRPLGEICVDRFKLDRLSLADALAEQWEEMQRLATHAVGGEDAVAGEQGDPDGDPADGLPAEDELRVLLEEAQAARAELELKTDELGKRLAALEALVVGVHDALVELRGAEPKAADGNGEQRPGNGSAGNRRRSSRGAARRPASA